jgi:hypothetical protein
MAHRMHINVTHLYADDDGETHLEDIEMLVPDPKEGAAIVSLELPASVVTLTDYLETDYGSDVLHGAPRYQLVVCLHGEFEVETTSGDVKRFRPGDWMLADDVDSKGHITRTVGEAHRIGLAIGLPDGWSLDRASPPAQAGNPERA